MILLKKEINSVISLYSNGRIQEALKTIENLIKAYPSEPLLFNIRGACYKAIGQVDEAIKSFENALTIKPDYAEVQYNLGVTFHELGQVDTSVKHYEKALAIRPDYSDAYNNLGNALKELGQLGAAVKNFEWAITYKPDWAEAHYNLGVTFYLLGQLDAAVKHYEKALAIRPDYAEAHNNLGAALHQLDQLEQLYDVAVKCFEKALAIKPDYAEAHNNLGIVLRELGQLDASIKNFEKAVAFKPDYAEAYHNLSSLKKYTESDSQISKMQSLLSTSDLSQSDRIHLCFALAKAYEDLGNQEELFKFLHEGNRLRNQELNYSYNNVQNYYSATRKLFSSTPSDIGKSLSYEPSTMCPIFIVGMPRSGTSLVEQIIACHHAVYGAGELNTLAKIIMPIINKHLTSDTNDLSEEILLSIRQQYLNTLSRFNVPESVITDKFPLNFQYIGFILTTFPEAKIVHLKRDARATCWSMYKSYFETGNKFAYNQEDLAGFYAMYNDLMAFWHQLYPGKIYDICYEDLTTNQEEETRKLLQYCELDWDENCLNFHTSKRAVKTTSSLQVRRKMYQGSSEAWKKHEAYLQPLIKALSSY